VGHGVPAALMTMIIKQALTTKRIGGQHARGYQLLEPAETLAKLNQRLVEQEAGSACFATAVYAVLNIDTGAVRLARAGHPLPLLLRGDGGTETIDADGPMLGVFETDDFQQSEFTLHRDDRLVLYSDGFEMAFPDPQKRGGSIATDRYLSEFEMLRTGSAREAMNKLAELLDTQAGSLNQRDDLTLLCTTRTAAANLAAVPVTAAPLRAAG
jgi:phosphoserine phosphatase RsbU/P